MAILSVFFALLMLVAAIGMMNEIFNGDGNNLRFWEFSVMACFLLVVSTVTVQIVGIEEIMAALQGPAKPQAAFENWESLLKDLQKQKR